MPRFVFIVNRDFHFVCPATKEYTPKCPARHLFRIRSNGKASFMPRGSSAQAKNRDLPDFEAISQTPSGLPSEVHGRTASQSAGLATAVGICSTMQSF
jgi:hypothetical protein